MVHETRKRALHAVVVLNKTEAFARIKDNCILNDVNDAGKAIIAKCLVSLIISLLQ